MPQLRSPQHVDQLVFEVTQSGVHMDLLQWLNRRDAQWRVNYVVHNSGGILNSSPCSSSTKCAGFCTTVPQSTDTFTNRVIHRLSQNRWWCYTVALKPQTEKVFILTQLSAYMGGILLFCQAPTYTCAPEKLRSVLKCVPEYKYGGDANY